MLGFFFGSLLGGLTVLHSSTWAVAVLALLLALAMVTLRRARLANDR